MNAGNIQLHQCIITTNLYIVDIYIQFDDDNPFKPTHLNWSRGEKNNDLKGQLTILVTLKTSYKEVNNKPVIL